MRVRAKKENIIKICFFPRKHLKVGQPRLASNTPFYLTLTFFVKVIALIWNFSCTIITPILKIELQNV